MRKECVCSRELRWGSHSPGIVGKSWVQKEKKGWSMHDFHGHNTYKDHMAKEHKKMNIEGKIPGGFYLQNYGGHKYSMTLTHSIPEENSLNYVVSEPDQG